MGNSSLSWTIPLITKLFFPSSQCKIKVQTLVPFFQEQKGTSIITHVVGSLGAWGVNKTNSPASSFPIETPQNYGLDCIRGEGQFNKTRGQKGDDNYKKGNAEEGKMLNTF
ncbi:hypothetical protein TNIN_490171 [Trichonephila inaurata madagascariensis]|uniref:Uncharacterized protein n=1 Tax=Trichonephila inaurata madagascariensis TaxID=2747483 RepID=A0A8X6MGA2_9ARAC|nr:hypothetical protein TNIN_490171 [Trichonephila inaurata madagascariensis]